MLTLSLPDATIAARLGGSLREYRLRRNMTLQEMASEIGISKPTLIRLENGAGTIANLIAALRVLRRLDLLDPMLEPPIASPMQMIAQKQPRLRASKTRAKVVQRPPASKTK